MAKKYILGIDIGGTKIEVACFDDKLKFISGDKISTPREPHEFLFALKSIIFKVLGKNKISAIGIGAPGELNLEKGTVLRAINTPAIEGMNLVKKLEDMFEVKVFLDNDVHALALGEAIAGQGMQYNSVFALTLGTGVGGGFIDKKCPSKIVFRGFTFSAAEVGHMVIAAEGAQCICGNRGCLEEYVSTRAIRRLSGMTPPELEKKAKEGNPRAKFTWSRIGFYLGVGLANIVNMFNPEIILIGGGISKASKYFISHAEEIMRSYSISPLAKKKTKIAIVKTPFAGARGAAALTLPQSRLQ